MIQRAHGTVLIAFVRNNLDQHSETKVLSKSICIYNRPYFKSHFRNLSVQGYFWFRMWSMLQIYSILRQSLARFTIFYKLQILSFGMQTSATFSFSNQIRTKYLPWTNHNVKISQMSADQLIYSDYMYNHYLSTDLFILRHFYSC